MPDALKDHRVNEKVKKSTLSSGRAGESSLGKNSC